MNFSDSGRKLLNEWERECERMERDRRYDAMMAQSLQLNGMPALQIQPYQHQMLRTFGLDLAPNHWRNYISESYLQEATFEGGSLLLLLGRPL